MYVFGVSHQDCTSTGRKFALRNTIGEKLKEECESWQIRVTRNLHSCILYNYSVRSLHVCAPLVYTCPLNCISPLVHSFNRLPHVYPLCLRYFRVCLIFLVLPMSVINLLIFFLDFFRVQSDGISPPSNNQKLNSSYVGKIQVQVMLAYRNKSFLFPFCMCTIINAKTQEKFLKRNRSVDKRQI